ncbi:MAG: IS200/IS605 family element transposase accessory protein TnpB [Candidatus Latescibacteria bacterium]|nr:IS200/IS605 family element transposase accessory protein TnpB [Candidatus Latescibacterota bacterium]
MEMTRTTKLKIVLPLDIAQRTVQAWTDACNSISHVAFEHHWMANSIRLHRLVYADVRQRFGLSAQVTANAIRHVASTYLALHTTKKHPKTPIRFHNNAVVLQGGVRGRDVSFQSKGVSISTRDGRIKGIPFRGEPKLTGYLIDWRLGDARLFTQNRKVYLAVSFTREVPAIDRPNDAIVGVDRGINSLATITDGQKQRFFGGGYTKHLRNRSTLIRANLQRKKAEHPTRSIRRALQRLSGRAARFSRTTNHVISKQIVQFAAVTGNPTIAREDLTGIRKGRRRRKTQRTDLNRWSFAQLEAFLRYKAEAFGFAVLSVDPQNTSRGCSRCGYTDKANQHRLDFQCHACKLQLNAELNASCNIRLRGILLRQVLWQDGPPSTGPEARPHDSGWNPDEGTGKLPALAGSS